MNCQTILSWVRVLPPPASNPFYWGLNLLLTRSKSVTKKITSNYPVINNLAEVFAQLSSSIKYHGESLVSVAQITAKEQARNQVEARVSTLYTRIDALKDRRSAMAICITETDNQRTIDALKCEMQKNDDGIGMRMAEINGMSATPTRSNHSPLIGDSYV